jgi:hypothetical protein
MYLLPYIDVDVVTRLDLKHTDKIDYSLKTDFLI